MAPHARKSAGGGDSRPERAGSDSRDGARRIAAAESRLVGRVAHYYAGPGAAVIELCGRLAVGDTIHVRGHTTDLLQCVEQLESGGRRLNEAEPNTRVGLAVVERVRPRDRVYRLAL